MLLRSGAVTLRLAWKNVSEMSYALFMVARKYQPSHRIFNTTTAPQPHHNIITPDIEVADVIKWKFGKEIFGSIVAHSVSTPDRYTLENLCGSWYDRPMPRYSVIAADMLRDLLTLWPWPLTFWLWSVVSVSVCILCLLATAPETLDRPAPVS